MSKLVTIGVSSLQAATNLSERLKIVRTHDYPNIEPIASDNGMNRAADRDRQPMRLPA